MAITLDGTNGITTPDLESSGPVVGTTGTFSGNVSGVAGTFSGAVQASGVTTNLYPLVSETAKSATGTTVDFTGIPSWVKRITVMFRGVSVSGTSSILIQLGTSGGVQNTGYISSSTAFSGTAGATGSSTAGLIVFTNDATYINSGIITITNITSNVWVNSGAGKVSTGVSWACGGDKDLAATLTQVRITTVNGTDTFDAGTINIMYE